MDQNHQRSDMIAGGVPFGVDAMHLLDAANGESDRLGHEYVGLEHILLALSRQNGDNILATLGVDVERVQHMIETTVRRGDSGPLDRQKHPFTSRTQKAFMFAGESAREFGHARVSSEHVLLGMLREKMNIGAQVLHDRGLTADVVAEHLRQRKSGT
jgi:ATP-dependent Clp protease ATP-binding subunit ClpA